MFFESLSKYSSGVVVISSVGIGEIQIQEGNRMQMMSVLILLWEINEAAQFRKPGIQSL